MRKNNQKQVNIAEAKKHLSEIIGKVAYGHETVILTKRGVPMAQLIPINQTLTYHTEIKGWLDNDDPFFDVTRNFRNDLPRVMKTDS